MKTQDKKSPKLDKQIRKENWKFKKIIGEKTFQLGEEQKKKIKNLDKMIKKEGQTSNIYYRRTNLKSI